MAAATTVAARADLAVEKAELLEHRLLARERARAVLEEALSLVPGHPGALMALEETAVRGDDAALLETVLERRLAAAPAGGERGRLLCRLALAADANPERLTEALDLWLRALDEDAGRGAAALARAGPVASPRAWVATRSWPAPSSWRPRRPRAPTGRLAGACAALARYRLGASARAVA